eukprot:5728727-Amphidinium_carterae.2
MPPAGGTPSPLQDRVEPSMIAPLSRPGRAVAEDHHPKGLTLSTSEGESHRDDHFQNMTGPQISQAVAVVLQSAHVRLNTHIKNA